MEEREYFIAISKGVSLRVRYHKDRGRILRFTVQLEIHVDDAWLPVTRYDTAHGFVHRDDLKPDGTEIKSPPMAFADNEDALNYAIRDLRLNYPLYVERYLRWKE